MGLVELKKKTLAGWWVSIWFGLCLDFYAVYGDVQLQNQINNEKDHDKKKKLEHELKERKKKHFRLIIDFLKNLFDFPCAMEGALKHGTFHNGHTGVFGVISSL